MGEKYFLKPCPFCGGNHLNLIEEQPGDSFSVRCEECDLDNGCCHSAKAAAEHWNRRAREDELEGMATTHIAELALANDPYAVDLAIKLIETGTDARVILEEVSVSLKGNTELAAAYEEYEGFSQELATKLAGKDREY